MATKSSKTDEDSEEESEATFSVDTHIFRELGEFLVGRESTALFELIKNSYDADATEVVVIGTDIDDADEGVILVIDNGTGMSRDQFVKGFLRIASRWKDEAVRESKVFHRRFTGSKGIGRLAAHKLAQILEVESVPGKPGKKYTAAIRATIDWQGIEEHFRVLSEVGPPYLTVQEIELEKARFPGTRIKLRNLRKKWIPSEQSRFIDECHSFQPHPSLVGRLSPSILPKILLFETPRTRSGDTINAGFELRLDGDFEGGESFWQSLAQTADWIVEIDASRPTGKAKAAIRYGIAPTRKLLAERTELKPQVFVDKHPRPEEGPFYQARLFVQTDPHAEPGERRRIREVSGVRTYVEGFRVLPYGEPGNDWLRLDMDYVRRSGAGLNTEGEVKRLFGKGEEDEHWIKTLLPNRSYFGAVFMSQDDALSLHMLVNREGFLPDAYFEVLKDTIRLGIDPFIRVRAAANFEKREERRKSRSKVADDFGKPLRESLAEAMSEVREVIEQAKAALVDDADTDITPQIERLTLPLQQIEDATDQLTEEVPMLRIVASVGTQMAAFVHEVRDLLGLVDAVLVTVDNMRNSGDFRPSQLRQLNQLFDALSEIRRALEVKAYFLTDIFTKDAARRRSRQYVRERVDSAMRLVQQAIERRKLLFLNEVGAKLKSSPMFGAELTAVFSNLITNAVKAAEIEGTIRVSGEEDESGDVKVTMENSGKAIDLADSERWFRPFQSSSTKVESTLGQGMGLGLTITRNILEQYGASIRFVNPTKGYATAIQITFPA